MRRLLRPGINVLEVGLFGKRGSAKRVCRITLLAVLRPSKKLNSIPPHAESVHERNWPVLFAAMTLPARSATVVTVTVYTVSGACVSVVIVTLAPSGFNTALMTDRPPSRE